MFTPTGIISSPFPITEITPTEEWACKPPVRGDHIRVSRGMYNHHGIYIADDEVIHFSSVGDDNLSGEGNEIIKSDVSLFHRGGRIQVKIYTAEEHPYQVEAIVHWARACIGEDGYCLFSNNCEHFASFCTLGKHRSHQVEKFISRIMGGEMGLLGTIGGFLGGLFGGGSSSRDSTTTTYEPDKVRVAEIKADCKLRLAGKEQERIILYAEKQMELLEFNARMEAAVIEARVRGEQELQKSMLEIMREVNIIAEQRLKLIETAHIDIIKQVEGYYKELENEIKFDAEVSIKEKLPALLTVLQQFEKGSTEHEIYAEDIRQHRALHFKFLDERIKQLHVRQNKVVDSCITGKEQINSSISLLVDKRMEQISAAIQMRQQEALPQGLAMPQIAQQLQIADDNTDASA